MTIKKWNYLLVIVLGSMFLLAACGGKSDEEKAVDALTEAFGNLASPAESEEPTVEGTLFDIRNFVTTELWNDGFVDIGWYISSGTSSTGETLDIDFTIQRLGKAVEKKAEYDIYINGLGTEYDSVKQVWTKLSKETDNLYEILKQNPPVANDENYKFDKGLFSQYSEAFDKEVDALSAK